MRNKLPKLLFVITFTFFAGSIVFRLFVLSYLSTRGSEIKSLEGKLSALRKENSKFSEELSSASSLSVVKEKALALGMQPSDNPVFLASQNTASSNVVLEQ